MKKILAFVLALVMVLGMATVASAANYTLTDPNPAHPTVTVAVADWEEGDTTPTLKVTSNKAFAYLTYTDNTDTAKATQVAYNQVPVTGLIDVTVGEGATKLFVTVYVEEIPAIVSTGTSEQIGEKKLAKGELYWDTEAQTEPVAVASFTLETEESTDVVIHSEVYNAVYAAYEGKADTIVIDLQETDEYITAEEWQFMTHGIVNSVKGDVTLVDENGKPYGDNGWWKSFGYLNMDIKLTDGTTIFYIDAADIDYTWNKDVDFAIDDGLTYTGLTKAEVYAAIRKLTGDTKNPYTFGFVTPSKVPTMTISYVIPQQWINVYGHKDLALWAYTQKNVTCEACGQKHDEFQTIPGATVDAIPQTQRIEFETDEFYSTIVLSKTAASTATDTAKADENPNTGANDIVNVAIVFSVISLAAAGAFVFSKQR